MDWSLKLIGNRETVRTEIGRNARIPLVACDALAIILDNLPAEGVFVETSGSYDLTSSALSMTVKAGIYSQEKVDG